MRFTEAEVYHIYNRGNNKQAIFLSEADYLLFLRKTRQELAPYCNILCWCLMPNHFHFLIQATEKSCELLKAYGGKPMQVLASKIGLFLSSYTQLQNKQAERTGSLFQQRTKAKSVLEMMQAENFCGSQGQYIVNLMHYIHQNPLRAQMINKMEDWVWSSFRDFAGFRNGQLCHKDILMQLTDYRLASFYRDSYAALSA